jgi:hypothetical protein
VFSFLVHIKGCSHTHQHRHGLEVLHL